MKRRKKNKIQELKEKAKIFILCFFALIILLIGCHYEATYTMKAEVYSINGNEITLEDITGNLFSYYGDTDNLYIGQTCKIKFDHNGTESNREDDIILSVKY